MAETTETTMRVTLLAHTQLSEKFIDDLDAAKWNNPSGKFVTDGQAVALTAIRTCYSANKPTEIVAKEGAKYFGNKATDGEGGTEADRLFRHITRSGHSSTLEHISFTFAIEGVSRSLLAQLTRHRVGFSFSVQSQRYVRLGSGDRSGGMDFVKPESIDDDEKQIRYPHEGSISSNEIFDLAMEFAQKTYDMLRQSGVPAEDARAVLPNATATNLVMTANLTALLSFYSKRRKGRGAQHEITELAEALRKAIVEVEPWTDAYFEGA
jgi:thymidylate synthase (FAD)